MSEEERPKRRVRYSGKNPRLFHQKYKEQQPERYGEDVEKVLASGKTPAGMHRPIMVREILDVLALKPGQTVVDCTVGYGGHAAEMARAIQPGGRLIGLDADPIELPKTEARLRATLGLEGTDSLLLRRMNFAGLPQLLATEAPGGVDAILADLGVSSMQIDNPARGFTFKFEGPLDLRMNPQRGQPASALLAKISAKELTALLKENSDEPYAERIALAVVEARNRNALTGTTTGLARFVREICPGSDDTVRRVFQALRIAVNEEFNALNIFLRQLPECLAAGGRVAILTFHSGEDRRVKHALKAGLNAGFYSSIAPDVVRVSAEELRANPRSSSAKLRWAVRA
ncbi:MAG: rsmH 1 [Chthoniobacteraceae bacterium]|nr:rsmH 1 [Chthoniobacteraceae bacterium]